MDNTEYTLLVKLVEAYLPPIATGRDENDAIVGGAFLGDDGWVQLSTSETQLLYRLVSEATETETFNIEVAN